MLTEQGFSGHGRGFLTAFFVEFWLYLLVGGAFVFNGSSVPCVLLSCFVTFALLRLALVAANSIPTYRHRSRVRAEHEIGYFATVAMLLREWWAAILTYPFLFAFEPWLVPTNPPKGLAHRGEPIVLVPGFFTNRGYLWAWRRFLLSHGYGHVYALSPEPIFHSVEKNAEHLARFVDEVLIATHAKRVILVGHSMGGLVIRLYLHRFGGMPNVALAVAVGSPLNGTILAEGKESKGPIIAQLTHQNAWVKEFTREAEAAPCPTPFISVWSPHDTIVAPQSSATIAPHYGRNIALPGVGHMEMVNSSQVMRLLKQSLDEFHDGRSN